MDKSKKENTNGGGTMYGTSIDKQGASNDNRGSNSLLEKRDARALNL